MNTEEEHGLQPDCHYMEMALQQAREAQALGEVPVGAVLVDAQGRVLAAAGNRRETWQDPTAHAELIVLRQAAQRMESWRLLDTTLYVTLEPCVMCMGGIILARIPQLVFGTQDPCAGAAGSIYNFATDQRFNHQVEVREGVCREQCRAQLADFFAAVRARKKIRTVEVRTDVPVEDRRIE
ncbi:MAG: tRNA adenosine(34) deaminase TadA [Desulfuromonadaceae bacterium]|nr:tRNA adenosine(34) deaminase TadA [Desulfuromonadaceae bacterium]